MQSSWKGANGTHQSRWSSWAKPLWNMGLKEHSVSMNSGQSRAHSQAKCCACASVVFARVLGFSGVFSMCFGPPSRVCLPLEFFLQFWTVVGVIQPTGFPTLGRSENINTGVKNITLPFTSIAFPPPSDCFAVDGPEESTQFTQSEAEPSQPAKRSAFDVLLKASAVLHAAQ